jgi:Zn finger protein HypA/HybF involved in hydrogenase expression
MWNKETLELAIKNNKSRAGVLKYLGFNTSGGNYNKLKREIDKYNLDTSHFITKSEFCKNLNPSKGRKYSIEEIFSIWDKKILNNTRVKNLLIENRYKEDICEECGIDNIWNNKPINLQLDHINGNNLNNEISNLRILCPNCHSQTNTFAGRNRENGFKNRQKIKIKLEKELNLEKLKNQLIQNIDFSKKTWGVESSKILNKSPQWSLKFIKKYFPELI